MEIRYVTYLTGLTREFGSDKFNQDYIGRLLRFHSDKITENERDSQGGNYGGKTLHPLV